MELWRRLILLFLVCTAIVLATFADLSPLVLVKHIDFSKEQKSEGRHMGVRFMTDEDERLSKMALHEYIAEKTKGKLFEVNGKDWKDLYEAAIAVGKDNAVSQDWKRRLPSDRYPSKVFFFRADEPSVVSLASHFHRDNDVVFASLADSGRTEYLSLEYRTYTHDDFHLGSGFTNLPTPPVYLLFPYRKFSLWLLLLGLLLYIFLPVQQAQPGTIGYPRWRMVLGDVASFLIIVLFFSFPFLITGGALQAFTQGWPLIFFFWPFYLAGIFLLAISAWFASYRIHLLEDRLQISTFKGTHAVSYGEMSYYQPVVFRPPRWLIVLSWLAALFGRGSARISAAGRAMILSGSASGSIGIRLKNGADLYITITDQMGSGALKGFKKILDAMKKSGVQEKDEVREIRSLGFETMRIPKKK